MSNLYSPLKIFHHREIIDQLRNGRQTVPPHMQLVISDFCNLNCSFCAYRTEGYASNELFATTADDGSRFNNPVRMIPYEKVIEILDDFVVMGVKAVQFTGGGEPSVHPRFDAILLAALSRGLEVGVVTNGLKLPDTTIEILLRARWVRVSLDAHEMTTYSDIKGVPANTLQKVRANLVKLLRRKREANSSLIVGAGFVVTKENWKESQAFTADMRQLGVDNVRLSAVFQSAGAEYFSSFYDKAAELCRLAKQEECEHFQVFNLFGDRVADLEAESPDYSFCGYQQLCSYIGADLNVYRCCGFAYNKHGLLGSIEKQSFKTFWQSAYKRNKIETFDARSCNRCQFNARNKTLLYALDKNPGHVNFV